MIGHIEHGSDFGGLFRYLLAQDKGARIISGLAAGRNAFELTQEFNNCADIRRTTTKPVKHFIVGFAPSDGYVDDEVKATIASKVVRELGYTRNQYLVVDHHRNDPGHDWNHDHDHIHIVANMVTLDGQRVDDWQDKRRFEKILRELEKEENLTLVAPSSQRKQKALSHGQVQRLKREISEYQTGERTDRPKIPEMVKLQAAIDAVCKDRPDLKTMVGRLQHLGIDVRPTLSDKGRKRISYALSDLKVRGSKLHNASFPKLIKERGLDFNLNRDRAVMIAVARGQKITLSQERLIEWSDINLMDYLPSALTNNIPRVQNLSRLASTSQTPEGSLRQAEGRRNEVFSKVHTPHPTNLGEERMSDDTARQQQLANLILNSNPIQVNTYLKDKGWKIALSATNSVEVKETSGHEFTIFTGFLDEREWEIESIMSEESTLELLNLVIEAVEKTALHLEIEPQPKPNLPKQKQKSIKKKSSAFELE